MCIESFTFFASYVCLLSYQKKHYDSNLVFKNDDSRAQGALIQARSACTIQLVGRRPNVYLDVGEFFVLARSACFIDRRRRVFIRPRPNILLA